MGSDLNFMYMTHDHTMYKTTFKGYKVLLLQQVDDMIIQTDDKCIAKEIFMIIKLKLKLKTKMYQPLHILDILLTLMVLILNKADQTP